MKRTTEEFIKECTIVHNNRYDYSKVIYIHKDKKIIIVCPIHGEFEQIAHSHVRGFGCKKCSRTGTLPKTIENFIKESSEIHNNKYDYSKVEYVNNRTKAIIICPIHGEFKQLPHNHLNGCGCYSCSRSLVGIKKRTPISDIIKIASDIHDNKYDYSKMNYISFDKKVTIICPIHGEFKQSMIAHITQKSECPKCSNELKQINSPSWSKKGWYEFSKKSHHFDSFKLYLIKCYDENEMFFKIGRTYNKLHKRFSLIPYKIEIMKIIKSEDSDYIFELEKRIKRRYKHLQYKPLKKFGGMYECFK